MLNTKLSLPRRRSGAARGSGPVTGLDIQPGEVVAAQVHVNGAIAVERAVSGTITHNMVREGEVADPEALGAWLKNFFAEHKLPSRVRVGLASQRAIMRVLDLPPIADAGDLDAAVRMQAPDHIAMPLSEAVMDHRSLGLVDGADGKVTRVVVVAAQREPVRRLLEALDRAGLRPEGIDLSAFALVRALCTPQAASAAAPVLYAHVGGVATVAIARGADCELTRVSPVGLEALSGRLAEREGVPLADARRRIEHFGEGEATDEKALEILDGGLAELADDLGKTIEFHAGTTAGEGVGEIVLSGPAALIPNFPEVLGQRMQVPVRRGAPVEAQPGALDSVGAERAAVAAGLAVEQVPA
jgi:type IV pilus assembly protein PilM